MAQLSESILKVVAYFDMFNYPVTVEEIRHFLEKPVHDIAIKPALQPLLEKQLIYKLGQFYSMQNDPLLVERRVNGNKLAVNHLKRAMTAAKVISWFPYIRGIGISGSLSKNFAYKGSDLDFFIITAANRLWIARTILLLCVRALNAIRIRHLCCLNYYIDEHAMEIEEKNIFTAVEAVTLIPAKGQHSFQQFFAANQWAREYLPNSAFRKLPARELSSRAFKWLFEWLMNNRIGDNLDTLLMHRFSKRWQKQLAHNKMLKNGVPQGSVIAAKHMCKPDARFFQHRILSRFREKIADISARYMVAAN